jgi:lysophospholipase L1-like esterase
MKKSAFFAVFLSLAAYCLELHAQPPAGAVAANPNTIYYAGGSCTFYDANSNVLLSVNAAEASWSASPAKAAWVLVNPVSGGYYEFPSYTSNAPTFNQQQYLQPFWKADTIFNELVLLNGVNTTANLMFKPKQVLSVTNFDFSIKFNSGTDYNVNGRTITQKSAAVSATVSRKSGTNGLLNTQPASWTCVTYIPDRSDWAGQSAPVYKGNLLSRTISRLKAAQPLVIQAYGMSITAGLNVSGFAGDTKNFPVSKPYMKGYPEMFAQQLEKIYGSDITFINGSCGGKTAAWVDQYCRAMVSPNKPDLVILDMGMNDIWATSDASFKTSMASAISKIKADCPDAEFILIGNMLPDVSGQGAPSNGATRMYAFLDQLKTLEQAGVALLDMTSLSDTIYRRKGAVHCTANSLHPNDYLARWYAHGLIQLLTESSTTPATYYVSPGGNNTDGLSPSTAWTSLDRVNAKVFRPGDRVLFEGGRTFNGNISLDANDANDPNNPVVFSSYGNGRATIRTVSVDFCGFRAVNTQGITLKNLIFTGPGNGTKRDIDGIQFYTDRSSGKLQNIELRGVDVSGFGYCGIRFYSLWDNKVNAGFYNVRIDSCTVFNCRENGIVSIAYEDKSSTAYQHGNFRLTRCKVYDIPGYAAATHKGSGIVLSQIDSALIERCEVFNTGTANTACGGPGGIWVWGANRVTIQFCESHHNSSGTGKGCDGLGFDLDGGVTNSVIQYCFAHDNDGAGYLLGNFDGSRPWGNNTVRYCISVNDARTNNSPVTLFTAPNTTWKGLKFYHNTIWANPSAKNTYPAFSAFQMTDYGSSMEQVACYNNIFATSGGLRLLHIPSTFVDQQPAFAGNLYWTAGQGFKAHYGSDFTSLENFRSAGSRCEKNGSVNTGFFADPVLLNTTKNPLTIAPLPTEALDAFKLGSNSPARAAALDLKALFGIEAGNRDYWGNPMGSTAGRDIGAHAFSAASGIESSKTALLMFPNPTEGQVSFFLPQPFSVSVFSLDGRTLWPEQTFPAGNAIVNLEMLPAGIFLVRVRAGAEHFNRLLHVY